MKINKGSNDEIIKAIEQLGYRVKITHERNRDEYGEFCPTGGCTNALLTKNSGAISLRYPNISKSSRAVLGRALCSENDYYNKKIGVRLALTRAVDELNNHEYTD